MLPITVKAEWIKGHQDENKKGRKIHGPFPRLVEINIEMDRRANKARKNTNKRAAKQRT